MARILAWTLTGVIAAATVGGCGTAQSGPVISPPPMASSCAPADDEVDYARVSPQPRLLAEAIERANDGHVDVRRKAGASAEVLRGDYVRIFTWGSMLPGGHSLLARRDAAGGWTVEQVNEGREGGRMSPEAPSIQHATLTPDQAARLNALVGDRCLYDEPGYFGRSVPMRAGGEAMCADGADSLIEVVVGGREHRTFQACHTFGRAGQAAGVLWEALQPAS